MSLEKILRLAGETQAPQEGSGDSMRLGVQALHAALSEARTTSDPTLAAELVAAAAMHADALSVMLFTEGMGDWVEATAAPADGGVMLAGNSKAPYGDVQYADNGVQGDGKKRYPVDTEEHTRAAWSYINQAKNAAQYSAAQLATIKGKIKSAMKSHGIGSNVVAASALEGLRDGSMLLAAAPPSGGVPMHHAPMRGRHSHAHAVVMVHEHDHDHMGDNDHGDSPECRGSGAGKPWSKPDGGWGDNSR
jgi:hypothetical protein